MKTDALQGATRTPTTGRANSLFGVLFFAAFGWVFYHYVVAVPDHWTETVATVTSVQEHVRYDRSDDRESHTWSWQAEYIVNESSYFAHSRGSSGHREAIGATVLVAYNPANPAESKSIATGFTKAVPWIFAALALLAGSAPRRKPLRSNRARSNLKDVEIPTMQYE